MTTISNKRPKLVQRLDLIRDECRGRKVLHLGCTNYPYTDEAINANMLLHFELESIASDVYGFDFDDRGLRILQEHGSKNLFQADLEKLEDVNCDEKFEVIVAGEMIEHLNNPGLFLQGVKRFMDEGTRLIITTINAYCAMRFAVYGLRGRGGIAEPVHPDHVAYYSYSTLNLLLKRNNFEVSEFLFYDVGTEHRPHGSKLHNMVNDIAVRISPQLADGIIAVCKL
jgi:SAM-dependent methyltransferase